MKCLRKTFLPPSPMHQPVEFEALVDEYLDLYCENFHEITHPGVSESLRNMARSLLLLATEYADDGSDPLELCDICNSELDFIDWFVDEIENGILE